MRRAVIAALLLACAGCGDATLVAEPAGTPYDGPLTLKPDFDDEATPLEQAGAAGLALECDTEVYAGGAGDYVDGGLERVQDTPREAVEDLIGNEGYPRRPDDGYVIERIDDDRVLMSYDVGEKTKVAFVVKDGLHDWDDHDGWGVESWGMCDPADLPAQVSERLDYQVWADADGARLPQSTVRSFPGAAHCDWQDLTWVQLGDTGRGEGSEFVGGDSEEDLGPMLRSTYDEDLTLPADATDTGYRYRGRELWLDPDGTAAYVVAEAGPAHAERWPASREQIGCA